MSNQTNLNSLLLVQKKLVRIISCASYKAHTGPLFFARRILSVNEISKYMMGIFMYQCLNCSVPDLFDNFFLYWTTLFIVMIHVKRMTFILLMQGWKFEKILSKSMVLTHGMSFPRISKSHHHLMYLNSDWGITWLIVNWICDERKLKL